MESRWALARWSEGDLRGTRQVVQPLLPVVPVLSDPLGPRMARLLDGTQREDVVAESGIQGFEVLMRRQVQAHEFVNERRDAACISDEQVDGEMQSSSAVVPRHVQLEQWP